MDKTTSNYSIPRRDVLWPRGNLSVGGVGADPRGDDVWLMSSRMFPRGQGGKKRGTVHKGGTACAQPRGYRRRLLREGAPGS